MNLPVLTYVALPQSPLKELFEKSPLSIRKNFCPKVFCMLCAPMIKYLRMKFGSSLFGVCKANLSSAKRISCLTGVRDRVLGYVPLILPLLPVRHLCWRRKNLSLFHHKDRIFLLRTSAVCSHVIESGGFRYGDIHCRDGACCSAR